MSDEDFFLKKMKGVAPLKKNDKLKRTITTIQKHTTPSTKIKIKDSLKTNIIKNLKEAQEPFIEKNYKEEPQEINKKLRRGKIKIDLRIDFHGNTLTEAEKIFNETVKKSYINNKRCILFVTGKGLGIKKEKEYFGQQNTPKLFYGKIRSSFMVWAKKSELSKYIMAVERAKIEHGGDGAFYVYLRKKKN